MRLTLWGNASALKAARMTFGGSWYAPTLRSPSSLKMPHRNRYLCRLTLKQSWYNLCQNPFLLHHAAHTMLKFCHIWNKETLPMTPVSTLKIISAKSNTSQPCLYVQCIWQRGRKTWALSCAILSLISHKKWERTDVISSYAADCRHNTKMELDHCSV